MDEPKNYTYDKTEDLYIVQKYFDGRNHKLARVKTEEDAQLVVAELRKVNWDRRRLPPEVKELILNSFREDSLYYTLTPKGKFQVSKRVKGRQTHFGNYDSLMEAWEIVNKLKMCRWEKNILQELLAIDIEQEQKRIVRQTRGRKRYKREPLLRQLEDIKIVGDYKKKEDNEEEINDG